MLRTLSREQLLAREQALANRFGETCQAGLQLDMTRGKPAPEQLDLASGLLSLPGETDFTDPQGTDCRNYGGLDGLPGMKALFAEILGCQAQQVIVGGSSSLSMMYDCVTRAFLFGVPGGESPWQQQGKVRFLCPVPGYDRHFAITERLGIELLAVDMTDQGPNMDQVEQLAADPTVKGIWCVPRYSNPTGVTYSASVIERLARMPAATDFRILWDNAYAEHHLTEDIIPLPDILGACCAAGHEDRVLMFASTSKITLAGAGVAAIAGSVANMDHARGHIAIRTIGPDKINQLRHLRFLRDIDGLRQHMSQHAQFLRPKFDLVQEILARDLGGKGIATWSQPRGGYFVSVDGPDGCARTVVELAGQAGVKLTPAGATFPYGRDPRDRNIRLAPSFPQLADIRAAMAIFTLCLELATVRQCLQQP